MDVKDFLNIVQESNHQNANQHIRNKIEQLQELEFLSSVCWCCDSLLQVLPAQYHNDLFEIGFAFDDEDRMHYAVVFYEGDNDDLANEFEGSDSDNLREHLRNFFSEEQMERLTSANFGVFSWNHQGIEKLKQMMMGPELWAAYSHAQLDNEVPLKEEKPKRPKV